MVSPRTGRPKVENPKNVDVKVRFDEELHKKLLKYCEEHNITRTQAIRQGIHLLLAEKNSRVLQPTKVQTLYPRPYLGMINLLYHTSYGFSREKFRRYFFMNNKEVLFELDSEITNLEFITRTFQALEIAVSEGASQVHKVKRRLK